jgi:hypothetical protein
MTTILRMISSLYLLFLVRPGSSIVTVTLCVFYVYQVIRKLTVFLHLQEFSLALVV